ncbi:MAG: biotin-dependent carboxyltransferase family protein [Gemmataceae bacterium]
MLRVLEPGLYTLVVDQGRPKTRAFGISLGGAADQTSLALGNALVGNASNEAALEFNLAGPTLRADCQLGCVITGAPFPIHTERRALIVGTTFTLEPGETLYVGSTPQNIRGYLCVRGGLQTPTVLGSRSSFHPLTQETNLPCQPSNISKRHVRYVRQWDEPSPSEIRGECYRLRILEGSHARLFPDAWYSEPSGEPRLFRVNPSSDRMGLRLDSARLPAPEGELVSEPVSPGTIQVTREGQCVILGVDGQTIGGYPKIAHVIGADLDTVGQLRPGDAISFHKLTLKEAEDIYRKKQAELAEWLTRIRLIVG